MRNVRRTAQMLILILILVAMVWAVPRALAQKQTTFCASWVINAERAMHILSVKKGYFKAEGLDVKYVRGYGSGDAFKRVGAGSCDIAETAGGAVVLGRAKGIPAKLVAMQSHKFEETLFFFAGSGINSPKDLEGKRVTGGPKAASNTLMFPLFAKANNIDLSKVGIIYMSPGAKAASLAAGKVDALASYHRSRPRLDKASKQVGKDIKMMVYADYGVDLYSGGITASDATIANKGEFVLGFLRGLFRGMAESLKDPEGTIDLFMKEHGGSRVFSIRTLKLVQDFWFDRYYKKEGLGHVNEKKMADTIRLTLGARGVKGSLSPGDVMTNRFIDQVPRKWRFPKS